MIAKPRSTRAAWPLLEAGVNIYEYQPAPRAMAPEVRSVCGRELLNAGVGVASVDGGGIEPTVLGL